ncbi:MAG TPA: hypothetical protein QF624_05265 [Dehalococcoidia bacterium]|nr:hypothetical protein [Dehalococcoidia bacterium]
MKFSTWVKLTVGASAGFFGARALMKAPELPEDVPPAIREQMQRASDHLRRARTSATEILVEMDRTQAAAEAELTEEYLRQQGRAPAESDPSENGLSDPS